MDLDIDDGLIFLFMNLSEAQKLKTPFASNTFLLSIDSHKVTSIQ